MSKTRYLVRRLRSALPELRIAALELPGLPILQRLPARAASPLVMARGSAGLESSRIATGLPLLVRHSSPPRPAQVYSLKAQCGGSEEQ